MSAPSSGDGGDGAERGRHAGRRSVMRCASTMRQKLATTSGLRKPRGGRQHHRRARGERGQAGAEGAADMKHRQRDQDAIARARTSIASIERGRGGDDVAIAERHDFGHAGRAAGRQQRDDPVGIGDVERVVAFVGRRRAARRRTRRGRPSAARRCARGSGPRCRRPSAFSKRPPGAPGAATNRSLALTALSCAAIASRVNSRLSGCTTAELIAAQ